jgi:transposase
MRAGRRARGYPSDLTDAQWQVIAPHLPGDEPGRRGRPRIWPVRRIVEAILYLDRAGCAWRYLPGDFPPWQTVYGYFAAWRDDGTLARLHDGLRTLARAAAGRNPEPTAAVTDSQSVRAADKVLPWVLAGMAVIAGLWAAGWITRAVLAYRQQQAAWHGEVTGAAHDGLRDREIAALRQAVEDLHARLAVRAEFGDRPGLERHEHVHFHGLAAGQIAAVLAARQHPPAQDRGGQW